ncbi:T5orf172 domain protein [Caballeronia concitans]|uniref:T5orf172 domain protein n=2 Tax=Caballeronia concitans TaxID=1777133 RepID=A0A658R4W3_9BURK|nr:T5orf172 domain protein [Caballeronia concitans]
MIIIDHLYVLANESMPGIYKIGCSGNPVARAFQLSSPPGVPTPFYIVGTFHHPSAQAYERDVHKELHVHRVSKQREFFCGLGLDQMLAKIVNVGDLHYENYEFFLDRIDAIWTDPVGGPRVRQHLKQLGIHNPETYNEDHFKALMQVLNHIMYGDDLFKEHGQNRDENDGDGES